MSGVVDDIKSSLLTDKGGESNRIKVDPGQTGFFAGREFRTFYEYSIPTGGNVILRFTSPVDFILWEQVLSLDAGGIKVTAITGATSGGTWTSLPVIGKNRMASRPSPYYTPVCTVDSGGTSTGGTVVEVVRLKTADVAVQAATVGAFPSDERGLPAGTYHIKLESLSGVNTTSTGVYSIFWEERV